MQYFTIFRTQLEKNDEIEIDIFTGMPPMGIPPLMPGQGGNQFYGGPPMPPNTNVPPPLMRNNTITKPPMLDEKPMDHPMPYPQPTGPPVTVFVGNITEKWPDAMIRQLLVSWFGLFERPT